MQGGSCQIYKQLHAQQSIAKKRTSKLKQTKKTEHMQQLPGNWKKKFPNRGAPTLGKIREEQNHDRVCRQPTGQKWILE
jgi:hypothetical protein